jgi:predicted RNA polymerase sigma factor
VAADVHLVRGSLLEELGRKKEARTSLLLARKHARNASGRAQVDARLAKLEGATSESAP